MLSLSEKEKILDYSVQFKEKNIPQYWEWATTKYELSQLKNPDYVEQYLGYPKKLLYSYNGINGQMVKDLISLTKTPLEEMRFEIANGPTDYLPMIEIVTDSYILNPRYPAYLESLRKIEQKRSEIETMLIPLERELLQIISYWEGDGEFHS